LKPKQLGNIANKMQETSFPLGENDKVHSVTFEDDGTCKIIGQNFKV
jgi:hypothetical protein